MPVRVQASLMQAQAPRLERAPKVPVALRQRRVMREGQVREGRVRRLGRVLALKAPVMR